MSERYDVAADHGVNVFIYDWYWYDRRPFLEEALNAGYLGARNNDRVKFYLMWANHDAMTLWDRRNAHHSQVVWQGSQDRAQFERIGHRLIEHDFSPPLVRPDRWHAGLLHRRADRADAGPGGFEPTARALG